ncbi:MAG TPA: hypothetical protein VKE88_03485 [Candidatus Nanoarchaeia archaeon]|nr:hypothetical protein [Candidatus Nanoarchaeia archaeon]
MVNFIESLAISWRHFKTHWKIIPLAAALDFLFFFLVGFVSIAKFRASSAQPLLSLIQAGGKLTTTLTNAAIGGESTLNVFLADPIVAASVKDLAYAAVLFVLLSFGFWVAFNGPSWYLAYRMMGTQHSFKLVKYILRFLVVSGVWALILSLFTIVGLRFIFFALLRPDQLFTSSLVQSIVTLLQFILLYFIFISLSFVPIVRLKDNFKNAVKYGFTEAPNYLAAFAVIVVLFYINFKVTFYLFSPLIQTATTLTTSVIAVTVLRFLIAAPVLTFSRMYLMTMSKRMR